MIGNYNNNDNNNKIIETNSVVTKAYHLSECVDFS